MKARLAWASVAGALLLHGCGEESSLETPDREVCLSRRDGARYCIEVYEASRSDASSTSVGLDEDGPPRSIEERLPWVDVTWAGARAACEKKGKRLCDRDEWLDACDGAVGENEGTQFAYGDTLDLGKCNVMGSGVEATGARGLCKSAAGVFDQSGNAWEWTGNSAAAAVARGGGFRSTQTHRCIDGDATSILPAEGISPEVGFRCCRDL